MPPARKAHTVDDSLTGLESDVTSAIDADLVHICRWNHLGGTRNCEPVNALWVDREALIVKDLRKAYFNSTGAAYRQSDGNLCQNLAELRKRGSAVEGFAIFVNGRVKAIDLHATRPASFSSTVRKRSRPSVVYSGASSAELHARILVFLAREQFAQPRSRPSVAAWVPMDARLLRELVRLAADGRGEDYDVVLDRLRAPPSVQTPRGNRYI